MEEDDENKMDIITEPPFSTANITNNNYLFYNNSYNPFASTSNLNQNSKDINERNPLNELNYNQQKKNEKFDRSATYNKRIKSHVRNSINSLYDNMEISKNKVMKIQIYKSQTRPRGRMTTFAPNSIKQEDILELNNNIIKEENENVKEKYLTLVKRIATQLKKRIKPPTKGYFHMYMIRTETYLKKVKKIGAKMRKNVKPPTHGFFYKYIEKVRYKLLVKRIAMQLKKRIKFPTCKILKIYQSYRNLIKKIANELNKSRKQRMAMTKTTTTTTTTTTIIQHQNIDNINNNNNKNLIMNNQINSNLNNNINSYTEITKKEIIQSNTNNNNYIENNEKIDIDEEEKPNKIEHQNINIENIENNNINNNNDHSNRQSSITNSIRLSGSNFSFNQQSNNEQKQVIIEEKKIITDNMENESHNNYVNPFSNNKEEMEKMETDNNICNMKEGKCVKTSSKRTKEGKNINFNLSLFKKEELDGNDNNLILSEKKDIHNSSYKKDINTFTDFEHNDEQELNVSLSNIEVTKSNFIHDFKSFLDKVNIEIVNNFPVSLNAKNKIYFQQSNFWLLIINYLFYQNNNISIYTIISLLEQYILWCTDINLENFTSIKERIKEYINDNYSSDVLNQFLFMNKFTCLDDIFQKYEIYVKNKEKNNYKEIKIGNINLSHNDESCQCELCTNDEACIKKVSDINKSRINTNNTINLVYISNNEKKSINKDNDKINNEELFYKGYSKKKQNIFSKSKTIRTGNTSLEYNYSNIEFDDNNKNYKGVSQKKDKDKEQQDVKDIEEEKKEEKEEVKEEKEEEKEEKEDDSDIEDKNKKKIKKTKKVKKNNKNKKKRESIKSDKDENENEEKEEEDKTEEGKSRSKSNKPKKEKKKKKSDKKKDEEKDEEKEKEESVEKDEEKEDENPTGASDSKRKKSKTPNKKRNKKH